MHGICMSVSTILKSSKDKQKYESIPQEQPKQHSVVAKGCLKPEYSDLQEILKRFNALIVIVFGT